MPNILHISDLHLSSIDSTKWKNLLSFLKSDIENNYMLDNEKIFKNKPHLQKPDIVVVSGDIARFGRDYSQAKEFLEELVNFLFNGDRNKIVIIPGNHDIDWDISKQCYQGIEFSDINYQKANKPSTEIRVERCENQLKLFKQKKDIYFSRFKPFSDFYNEFYKGSRHFSPEGSQSFYLYDYSDTYKIVIIGFNSCIGVDHLLNQPSINENSIIAAAELLNSDQNLKEVLRIAVWHHGLKQTSGNLDFLDKEIIEVLLSNGFSLLLHGHLHEPQKDVIFSKRDIAFPVIGAGTIGAKYSERPESAPFEYNLINIDYNSGYGYVHTRKRDNERSPWQADFRWSGGSEAIYEIKLPEIQIQPEVLYENDEHIRKSKEQRDSDKNISPANYYLEKEDPSQLYKEARKTIYDRFGLRYPKFIIGRKNDLSLLYRRLLVVGDNVCIQGPQWCGKTTILQALSSSDVQRWVKKKLKLKFDFDKFLFMNLDLRNFQGPEQVLIEISSFIAKAISSDIHKTNFTELLKELDNANLRLILLFDNFDTVLEKDAFESTFLNMIHSVAMKDVFTVAYTRTIGREISTLGQKKARYFHANGYDIGFLENDIIEPYVQLPLKIINLTLNETYVREIRRLGGNHPFFLSIARRILYEHLNETEEVDFEVIIDKVETHFDAEVEPLYKSVLLNLSGAENRLLYEYLTGKKDSPAFGEKILSLGSKQYGSFTVFSEHFKRFFLELFYPIALETTK